jgi:hypothetical protein
MPYNTGMMMKMPPVPKGFHRMPDGTIMRDSDHKPGMKKMKDTARK